MIFVIYFTTLILASMITFPFRASLKKAFGHSMLPDKLLYGFNFTIFSDIIKNHGDLLFPFIQIMFWAGLLYIFFSIFFTGGILNTFQYEKNRFSMQTFFEGCGKFFLRFFRLTIFVFLLNIIIAVIVYVPFGFIFESYSETASSEKAIALLIAGVVTVHLLLIIFSLIISDYAKIRIVVEDTRKVFKTFWLSIKFVFKHFVGTYLLYLLLLIFPFLLLVIYLLFEKSFNADSAKTILTIFFIQQFFIWFRVFGKVWFLRSELYYYKNFIEEKDPLDKKHLDLKDLINPDEILDK